MERSQEGRRHGSGRRPGQSLRTAEAHGPPAQGPAATNGKGGRTQGGPARRRPEQRSVHGSRKGQQGAGETGRQRRTRFAQGPGGDSERRGAATFGGSGGARDSRRVSLGLRP